MAIDRSKFSGAKVTALKGVQKDAKENDKSFGKREGRLGFLSVEDGKNVFRILPPHPNDTIGASYLPKRTAMLKCEVPEYKDGEETGKTEIKSKNIFVATQHGGLHADPIELYIKYVQSFASDAIGDKEERQKFLYPITGWRDKKGWNWGIIPKTSYVCYAVKDKEVGRLELWEQWIKEMDKLAISEEADEVMAVDPFSDPDEGFPVIITKETVKDKQGKDKLQHTITKDEPSRAKRESWEDFFARVRVTDEQLTELEKQEPLSVLYGKDIYNTRDWELAIDGLQRFDLEHKYGIFENDDFLEELKAIEVLVPEPKDKEEKETKSGKDIEKMFDKKDEKKSEGTDEEEISPAEMKFALKKFIKKEFGEDYIDQVPSKKEDLEKWYCMYSEGDDLPIKLKNSTKEEKDPNEGSVAEEGQASDTDSEIEKLKQKRRGTRG